MYNPKNLNKNNKKNWVVKFEPPMETLKVFQQMKESVFETQSMPVVCKSDTNRAHSAWPAPRVLPSVGCACERATIARLRTCD